MRKLKLLVIPIAAFLGALLGSFIAPEPPLYPFSPSSTDMMWIRYTELHIAICLGFFASCLSFGFTKILKTSLALSICSIFAVGLVIGAVDDLRFGETPDYNFSQVIAYLLGFSSWYGIVYLTGIFIKRNNGVSNT
jgi:hypothetical protein